MAREIGTGSPLDRIAALGKMRLIAIASSVLAAVSSTGLAASPPVTEQVGAMIAVGEANLSVRLREFTFRTPLLATRPGGLLPGNPEGQTKVRVLVPEGYDPAGKTRYPVLYLFHGGGGNQTEWTTPAGKGDAEQLTAGFPLIVVMPEGGIAGGYADWYNGGAFGAPRWQTYHLDRLIPWIDAHFRTIADRGARATAGLSMGGGGLRYAAMRPDLIGATASFSGDIDILQPASDWNGMGAPVSRMIWGDRKTQEVRWRGANGPDLAKNLANTDVSIFSGDTGRPEGVYILQGARAMHERLDRFGIAHRFAVYPGMTHSWPTWNKALADWLPGLMGAFHSFDRTNSLFANWAPSAGLHAKRPDSFTYSSIEPNYSVFGWDVQLERKVTEFSALEVAGPLRFTLTGSGNALVRTPSVAKPHTEVRVSVASFGDAGVVRILALRTDAAGRIAVPLILGPANALQQYSPEADAASTGPSGDKVPFEVFNNGSRFYRATVQPVPLAR